MSDKVATKEKNISTAVLAKINTFEKSGELVLPKDYSPANALKSAYLVLSETKNKQGKFALQHCTQESIANALLKMVVWGVSPLKKQCDLIMYGDKLELVIEYTGNIALAKRYAGMQSIKANAVFQGDVFEFEVNAETGRKKVTKHEQKLENLSKDVVGAYAVVVLEDGSIDTEIMNIDQIRKAWNQGAMKGNSPAHRNFMDQMSVKTVINRATKLLIRGSNDAVLQITADTDDHQIDTAQEDMKHEISTQANAEEISFEEVEDADVVKETEDEENERLLQAELDAEAKKGEEGNDSPGF